MIKIVPSDVYNSWNHPYNLYGMRQIILKEGLRLDTKSLGNRIQQLREECGLTQEELAAKTDISIKHISVLERGLKEPRLTTFLTIAEALGVTPNELLSAPSTESDYMSIISYKAAQLSEEKQKSLLKIINTLVEEL